MTNYRIRMCIEHDLPQFKYCFDCGALIVREGGDDTEQVWTCSKNWVHLRIWAIHHEGNVETTDCTQGIEFE